MCSIQFPNGKNFSKVSYASGVSFIDLSDLYYVVHPYFENSVSNKNLLKKKIILSYKK